MARPSGERPTLRAEFGHRLSARLARAALRTGGPALESRNVGNALLVHPRGFVDSRALRFTQRLAADPHHTLVVLDLPASPQDTVWETVARTLDRRGQSFRLVPGRGTRDDVKHAAQWLADRLERIVLAPDGAVLPAAGGALFVPAHHGLGWLRYRPNLPSVPEARRFPKPQWESSVPDQPRPTGAGGMVEPLPGGVWIRGTWEDAAASAHRQQLMNLLAARPDVLGVAIGSPGTSALPMEEIAAFWHTLAPDVRRRVRFIPYGPVAVPEGEPLGQALADLLDQRIAVCAGIPVPGADNEVPQVRTLQRDGTLGWRPYADEFGFTPRSRSGGRALAPVPLNTRAPVGALPAVAPGVYEYAPDVVLEVVQSGLWVRSPAEPPDGNAVRSSPADPAYPAVLYDGTDPVAAERLRFTAYELLRGLDPSFGRHSRVMPSSEAGRLPDGGHPLPVAGVTRSGSAFTAAGSVSGRGLGGSSNGRESAPLPSVDAATWADHRPAPVSAPAPVTVPAPESGFAAGPESARPGQQPSLAPRPGPPDSQPRTAQPRREVSVPDTERPVPPPVVSAPERVATSRDTSAQPSVPPSPAVPPVSSASPVPVASASPVPSPAVPPVPAASAPPVPAGSVPRGPAAAAPPVPPAPEPTAPPASVPSAPAAPVPPMPPTPVPPGPAAPSPATRPEPAPGPAVPNEPVAVAAPPGAPRIRLESPTPQPVRPNPQPPARPADVTRDSAQADGGPAPEPAAVPTPEGPTPRAGDAVQTQPRPTAAASVVPPQTGVDRERDWVRRSLGERYDTAAAFVSRVLSESPGLHGGPRSSVADALTDLAAVRLYLSGATSAIDVAIRAGTTGPHVPLARCAAGGLRRLPSYRGAAMVRATLTAAERGWYQEGRLVAENSFLMALSSVRRGMPGNTDVLLWSLTARRTALVAPDLPDRVLFAPGTRFKVLRVQGGDRPAVMLRELAASELDEHGRADGRRVPLDEIALTGLEQFRGLWKEAENGPEGQAGEPLSEEDADALCAAPGLQIPTGGPGGRQPAPSPGTVPQKGAKP
ncbi:hypothetical protein ACIRVK_31935 [Streptomyces sp. NPDC101152]|uniref:hypothetical protein n=1 Tax=Streptomyces sp. NPDC101152 TaxID=3366116 RepID=UPI0037F633B0